MSLRVCVSGVKSKRVWVGSYEVGCRRSAEIVSPRGRSFEQPGEGRYAVGHKRKCLLEAHVRCEQVPKVHFDVWRNWKERRGRSLWASYRACELSFMC